MGKVVVEKVKGNVNTNHVPNVERGQKRHGKRHDKELEVVLFDQAFNAESDKRQKDQAVDPHGIVCHDDGIAREGVAGRENDGIQLLCGMGFVQVIRHGGAHGAGFEKDDEEQSLGDMIG